MHATINRFKTLAGLERQYPAATVFKSQGAALYHIEGVARMVMPGHHLAGLDRQRSRDYLGGPVELCESAIVPSTKMLVVAE